MTSFPSLVLRSPILSVSKHSRPTRVLCSLISSVSRHSRRFAGVAQPIIGCFETPEAYAGVMHPYIECFVTLAALNLVSRNTGYLNWCYTSYYWVFLNTWGLQWYESPNCLRSFHVLFPYNHKRTNFFTAVGLSLIVTHNSFHLYLSLQIL